MSYVKSLRIVIVPFLAAGLLAVGPAPAEAQRRAAAVRGHRPAARQVVVLHGFSYPRYYRPYWSSFQYGSQWGPWGPYPPYGYGYGFRDELTTSLRLEVTPRDAEVFVDGYAAGVVDDFDGVFQRLRLRPGGHEIVVYLDGYRTLRQTLYLNPGSSHRIRHTMEALGPGEPMEAPPTPADVAEDAVEPTMPRSPLEPRPAREEPAGRTEPRVRFGTLSIRVQPADSEIVIDGERWTAPADQARIAIQLGEGRHRVEIRKPGFAIYREDVLIRPNATLSLNVSLLQGE